MQAILPAQMKQLIRARLLPGRSLEREVLKSEVFSAGGYSYSAEALFDAVLDELVRSGELKSVNFFGPFELAPDRGPKPRRKASR